MEIEESRKSCKLNSRRCIGMIKDMINNVRHTITQLVFHLNLRLCYFGGPGMKNLQSLQITNNLVPHVSLLMSISWVLFRRASPRPVARGHLPLECGKACCLSKVYSIRSLFMRLDNRRLSGRRAGDSIADRARARSPGERQSRRSH